MATLAHAVVPVTPFQQNCTLIWDTDSRSAVVVDPGGDADRILAKLAQEKLTVAAIWLTHGHLDHAGAVEPLRAALGGAVQVLGPHRADAFLLETIEQQAAQFGLTGVHNARSDRWISEGDTVMVGTHCFDVLHCPGHTPGHVAFVNKAARFAQVGDVLFAGSVGRTDFEYGNHAALIESIKAKLLPLGDDVHFICGHGAPSTIGRERLGNPFLQ